MKSFLGYADLAIGLLFVAAGVLAVSGMPKAASRYSGEPEDLVLLIVLLGVSAVVAGASILGGSALIRGQGIGRISTPIVAAGLVVSSLLLAAIAALGFWSGDPSSVELRLLVVPALLLGASSAAVARTNSRARAANASAND